VTDLLPVFDAHRRLLFGVAYQMLGSVADAEDAVQEAWLRWSAADRDDVADPRAWLVRTTTRLALDRLTSARARRESYVGPWLPEPLLTTAGGGAPDPADEAVLGEQVSLALLVVLESLSPAERAVFVLREVFDVPYDEIAEAIDKSPASVRQIAHRARDHVAARRPRVQVARSEHEQVVQKLAQAVNTGDLQALMDVLAPDVVSVADGGGRVRGAARRPVVGAEKLAKYLLHGVAKYAGRMTLSPMLVNGEPALRVEVDGEIAGAVTVTVEDGKVSRIYAIANPDKLEHLDVETLLSR
jgi:RNA polymerase sigma-70 factor (ECF subfamily)